VTTEGLKSWIIIMAVLVLILVYLAQTSGGSLSSGSGSAFDLRSVLSGALLVVAAWRWGGWTRS
jgi:hypothetical protein